MKRSLNINASRHYKKVCQERHTTMVISIHQPAENLFRLAKSLMVLSSGRVAYCGAAANAVDFFAVKMHKPIPAMTSSSEYLLDLVNADFTDLAKVNELLLAWPKSAEYNAVLTVVTDSVEKGKSTADVATTSSIERVIKQNGGASLAHHTWALFKRGLLNALRNPLVIWLRLALYVALSIMIGTVWMQIGNKSDVVVDIVGALFFVAAFMVFMSVSVLPAFLEEKAVFVRERANGSYSVAAFVLAHTAVDVLFMAFQATVCSIIVYWLVGLNAAADRFFFFLLDLFLSFLVAESIMLLVSAVVPVAIVGIALGAMIYGAFMVVQGFFIKLENIGWWWRWMHWVSMHSYSFSAFMHNEFHGRVFDPSPNASGGPQPGISGDTVLAMYDFAKTKKWDNMVVLVAMAIGYRVIAAVIMHRYHNGKK